MTSTTSTPIQWIVRPANIADKETVRDLLFESYESMLKQDYTNEILSKALPDLSTPREELLTCGTWYVVEHPMDRSIVGCGGWTPQNPAAGILKNNGSNMQDEDEEEKNGNNNKKGAYECTGQQANVVPHLRHFSTKPNFAQKGVGKAIWRRCQEDIRDQIGCDISDRISMEVFSTLTAKPFYLSLGFETVKYMSLPIREDCDFPCIFMRRPPQLL